MEDLATAIGIVIAFCIGLIGFAGVVMSKARRPSPPPPEVSPVLRDQIARIDVEDAHRIEVTADAAHTAIEDAGKAADGEAAAHRRISDLLVLLLVLLASGCLKPGTPPDLFAVVAEPVPAVETFELPVDTHPCTKGALLLGERPAWILDAEGRALCSGQVISTTRAVELLHAEVEAERLRQHLERIAATDAMVHTIAQEAYAELWQDRAEAVRRERWIRVAQDARTIGEAGLVVIVLYTLLKGV